MPLWPVFWMVVCDNMAVASPSPAPRLAVFQNLLLVPLAEISVRFLGWKRTWQILAAMAPKVAIGREPEIEARIALKALKRGKLISPLYGRCLARSLILWWQLDRRGVPVTLNIGVRKQINFKAHAWVELDGKPLNAGKLVNVRYNEIAKFNHPDALK